MCRIVNVSKILLNKLYIKVVMRLIRKKTGAAKSKTKPGKTSYTLCIAFVVFESEC